jgi:hypothetical protein
MSKRRYSNPLYPGLRQSWFGFWSFGHVLNLFVAYRRERRGLVMTERYREWLRLRGQA